jgi:hypothetical protein
LACSAAVASDHASGHYLAAIAKFHGQCDATLRIDRAVHLITLGRLLPVVVIVRLALCGSSARRCAVVGNQCAQRGTVLVHALRKRQLECCQRFLLRGAGLLGTGHRASGQGLFQLFRQRVDVGTQCALQCLARRLELRARVGAGGG